MNEVSGRLEEQLGPAKEVGIAAITASEPPGNGPAPVRRRASAGTTHATGRDTLRRPASDRTRPAQDHPRLGHALCRGRPAGIAHPAAAPRRSGRRPADLRLRSPVMSI